MLDDWRVSACSASALLIHTQRRCHNSILQRQLDNISSNQRAAAASTHYSRSSGWYSGQSASVPSRAAVASSMLRGAKRRPVTGEVWYCGEQRDGCKRQQVVKVKEELVSTVRCNGH